MQCAKSAQKANLVLGQLSRAVHFRDKDVFIALYKTYVRCHLEYCIQAWCPWKQSDIDILESVQKRAVNMVSGLLSHTYEDKLREVGLMSLVQRRQRGDMIQTWKILSGHDQIDRNSMFTLATDVASRSTRQSTDPLHIVKPLAKLDLRRHFFSIRVCDPWNDIPLDIRQSPTLNSFKNSYDKWLEAFL